jgi:hypothetical protein
MMLRQKIIKALFFAGLIFYGSCRSYDDPLLEVVSPDQALKLILNLNPDGSASYQIWHRLKSNWKPVTDTSSLGLILKNKDFSRDLTLVSISEPINVSEQYKMVSGKQISNEYEAAGISTFTKAI